MSLYKIGQRVVLKEDGTLWQVSEANYVKVGGGRKAHYLIQRITGVRTYIGGKIVNIPLPGAQDLLTGSDALYAADYGCDGCGKWRSGSPYRIHRDRDGYVLVAYCFPCVKQAIRDGETF